MELKTARLLLRPFCIADVAAVHAYQSDADALQYEPWGPHTLDMVRSQLEMTLKMPQARALRHMELAIARSADGQVIGGCKLELPMAGKAGWATMGYVLARAYWGQGYATEAAAALIAHARTVPDVVGVKAISDSHNLASKRVLEKCGMECVGLIAEIEEVKGRFRDMLKYELVF